MYSIVMPVVLDVYLSTTLYDDDLRVHKRSTNRKTPISLSVPCKVRYQQLPDNAYRVLQQAFIVYFQCFAIPYSVPYSIPFHLLQFPCCIGTWNSMDLLYKQELIKPAREHATCMLTV